MTSKSPTPPTISPGANQVSALPISLSLIGFSFCCRGCLIRPPPITNHHLHHIGHLLFLAMIGWAVWDREFLIGQSAPRLANKNRVRERSGSYVCRVFVDMFRQSPGRQSDGGTSLFCSRTLNSVLFTLQRQDPGPHLDQYSYCAVLGLDQY